MNAMGDRTEEITVSKTVKRYLNRRKIEGESYNDVLKRLLAPDGDRLAGFGRWSEGKSTRAREIREKDKEKSKERSCRRSEDH